MSRASAVPPRPSGGALQIGLLGPLQVRVGDRDVPVTGARSRVLLATLALAPGRSVRTDTIAAAVWGDAPPAGVANALQARVTQLRKALAAAGAGDVIATDPGAYRLASAPEAVDAVRFEQRLDAGAAALAAGDAAGAVDALREALALWRGDALADVVDLVDSAVAPDVAVAARRLDELRLRAVERRVEAELALGAGPELVAELEALVALHPLREALWGHLMVALSRAQRHSDALDAYQRVRVHLRDELGTEPGPELRRLQERVLVHDPALQAPRRSTAAAARPPTNLRRAATTFVGRQRETGAVAAALGRDRLVTLVGPGGTGKTRLAVEVAQRLLDEQRAPDGVWLVELGGLAEGDDVLPQVALALGVATVPAPAQAPRASLTDRLLEHVAARELVVVLDNCEHLLDAAAAAAETLLAASHGSRVLATSREALRVPGEVIWAVPPLPVPSADAVAPDDLAQVDAVRLFVDRARAADRDFRLDQRSAAPVAEVCRRLDGLPLAIELAAGRVGALPVEVLARRLGDRFRLLTGGSRTAARRQQTLEAVVEWSYDLLDDAQRTVFRRLGAFAGGADLEALEAVCAGDGVERADVLPLVTALADKSLVVVDAAADGPASAAGVRYAQLETLREFALRRLVAADDADATRSRHAAWYCGLARRAEAALRSADQLRWLARLETEHDNLRAALAWTLDSDPPAALRLATDLAWFWWLHDHRDEAVRWLSAALAAAEDAAAGLRALGQGWLALHRLFTGPDVAAAQALAAAALDGIAAEPEPRTAALVTALAAEVALFSGDAHAADGLLDAAEAHARAGDEPWIVATCRLAHANLAYGAGRVAEAVALADAAVALSRSIGDRWSELQGRQLLATAQAVRGDYADAEAQLTAAIAAGEAIGVPDQVLALRVLRGNVAMLRGDLDEARRVHEAVLARAGRGRWPTAEAMAWNGLGMVARRSGDVGAAATAYRHAAAAYAAAGNTLGQAEALAGLAFACVAADDAGAAADAVSRAAELVNGDAPSATVALVLEGAAAAALAADDADLAARRLGAASALRDSLGMPLRAGERHDVDRLDAALRERLGAALAERYAEGAAAGPSALL